MTEHVKKAKGQKGRWPSNSSSPAGMTQVPTTGWTARQDGATDTSQSPLPSASWDDCGIVAHVFTHFELRLTVYAATGEMKPEAHQWWSQADTIGGEALPTVMKKVLALAIESDSQPEQRK